MAMRVFSTLFLLSLISFAFVADARKDPGDYWKNTMNGEPMPKTIEELLVRNPTSNRFTRNFGMKSNVIIYHRTHVHTEKSKPSGVED